MNVNGDLGKISSKYIRTVGIRLQGNDVKLFSSTNQHALNILLSYWSAVQPLEVRERVSIVTSFPCCIL